MQLRTRKSPLRPLFRSVAAFVVIATVAAFAACSDDTGPSTPTAGGVYPLATVNGQNVPFTFTSGTQHFSPYTGALRSGNALSHSSLTFSNNGVVWVYNHA